MNIVNKMIEYRETRKSELFGASEIFDQESFIVIITEILSWLKLERKREIWIEQGRKTKLKPMKLNMNYAWCNDLVKILQMDNPLSEVFSIENGCMTFKEGISDELIHNTRLLADEMYNPQMVIG